MSNETEVRKSDSIKDDGKPTMIFWTVALLSLFFGIGIFLDYYMITSGNEAYLAGRPSEFKDFVAGFPVWRETLWLFAIVGALLGGILMLLRSAWAVPVLWVVPISMIVGFVIYDLLLSNGIEAYGTFGIISSTIIILISLTLALYAAGCDEDEILT